MLEEGYVKMFRQLKHWQHYQKPSVVLVWIDILLSVNTQDAWWHGRKIRRGELFTSVETIHQSTGLDPKTIRKVLDTLEESGEIKREATTAGTKITINHFNKFQGWGISPQPTPQPTPQRLPYQQEYKEVEERKEEKNINPLPHARAREIGIEAFGSFSNVYLFPGEHRQLVETYGQVPTDKAVDDLSCKIAEGDEQALNSRNHYATLDRWLRYKREKGDKVPMSNSQRDAEIIEKSLRQAWEKAPENERQEYLQKYGCYPWEKQN